ncbi:methyltransferase [Mycobacterium sp. 050134]|uniref:methyltransferase n=1 Tax=Mycobacterium sp. 050134 TaxID=3096111 RepID=UPI002ED8D8CB
MLLEGWTAQAITAAVQLGIADALGDGPLPLPELARRVEADPDAVRRLMRALMGRGIFRLRGDGRYELNALGDALRSDARFSAAGPARMFGSPEHREIWSHLADSIRSGSGMVAVLHGSNGFEYLNQDPERVEVFNKCMADITEMVSGSLVAAYPFGDYPTIVDVGGGTGQTLAAVLRAAPASRGVLHDLPAVVAGAAPRLWGRDVADRVKISEGSFFETVPGGGDLYLLKQVLHDWPDADAIRILENVRSSAPSGATILAVEYVVPEHNRDHPGHWSDLEMLVMQGGRERTAAEYRRLLESAGLRMTRVVPTISPMSLVEARAR